MDIVFLFVIGITFGAVGTHSGKISERERWCKYLHEKYAEVDKCMEEPDYGNVLKGSGSSNNSK